MHIGYVGNFKPTHSTENHIATAVASHSHKVSMLQEDSTHTWDWLAETSGDVGLLLWTHTGGLPPDPEVQSGVFDSFRAHNPDVQIVGVHLDRWWGLPRETQITQERKPFFFEPDVLYTADGGHDDMWAAVGVTHRWFPPGVSGPECVEEPPSRLYESDVAFVGSWQGGYHPEWAHRHELVEWLQRSRFDVKFWPEAGRPAVRGRRLRALYASAKVIVGDSCLAPRVCAECGGHGMKMGFGGPEDCGCYRGTEPITHYCSDRIPETTGRGGVLIHPEVEGITYPDAQGDSMYDDGIDLRSWVLGDWDALETEIDMLLAEPEMRAEISASGRARTLEHHTYEVRMAELIAEVMGDR